MSVKPKVDSFTTVSATGAVTGIYDVYQLDATAGNMTVTLPSAAAVYLGRPLLFRRVDSSANTVVVQRAGTDTIDGATNFQLDVNDRVQIFTVSSTQWRLLTERDGFSTLFDAAAATPIAITGNYDIWWSTPGGAVTFNLPTAASVGVGRVLAFVNNGGGGTITLTPSGADTITGTATLATALTRRLYSDGVSNWKSFN